VTGVLEQNQNQGRREEIFDNQTRKFLQAWKDNGIDGTLQIFAMKNCTAVTWTMETNFEPKVPVRLC
ncbi:MAG: pyridoxamine 5'-phosphate oxidase family protein, partial [Oscillospiraceae bacterium]|nr:pyridoxamine 5'-phosphate oxidase family protein [Oscillospiraceae bacterium]